MSLRAGAGRKARCPPARLHECNHFSHTAIGNRPPITRLTNLPGQYTLPPSYFALKNSRDRWARLRQPFRAVIDLRILSRSVGEGADLDEVVGEDRLPGPYPDSLQAVDSGAIPAVSPLEAADRPSLPVRHFTVLRNAGRCSAACLALPGQALLALDVDSAEPTALADAVRAVFDPHRAFSAEITQFFAAINQ
jgi:hypothetical protein